MSRLIETESAVAKDSVCKYRWHLFEKYSVTETDTRRCPERTKMIEALGSVYLKKIVPRVYILRGTRNLSCINKVPAF